MMRNSGSKIQGKVDAVNSESPLENGLPPKEDEDDTGQNVRELAAKVVDDVVKMASEAAQQRTTTPDATFKNKGCNLQRLPTIQIDTVPSAPSSPVDWTPPDESIEDEHVNGEPLNESDIQFDLDTTEQESETNSEDLRESLKTYVEDILSEAMVVAEKKLQFAGLPDEEEEEEEAASEDDGGHPEPGPSSSEPEKEIDESEIRVTAEKVVQEVITKASETAVQKLENGVAGRSFPGLPSIQIDMVKSPPPSPETTPQMKVPQKKWTFKLVDDSQKSKDEKSKKQEREKPVVPITFAEAPEDVKDAAERFVKEIVGRAIAMAEEKTVQTVPFNFEDVNLMKTSGPWYIRAREALIRLLRIACFCTPRRTDS